MSKHTVEDEEARPFIRDDNDDSNTENNYMNTTPSLSTLHLAEISQSMDEDDTIQSAKTLPARISLERSPFAKKLSKNIFSIPLQQKQDEDESQEEKIGSTEARSSKDLIPTTPTSRNKRRHRRKTTTFVEPQKLNISKNESFLDELTSAKAESRNIDALDLEMMTDARKAEVEKRTDKFYKRSEHSPNTASSKYSTQSFNQKPKKGLKTVSELRRVINFQSEEKRFLIVGLDHECDVFTTVEELWSYIQKSFDLRNLRNKSLSQFETMWIDIQNASIEDLRYIEKCFHLHPLTTEDCSNDENTEKWELFEHYLFVVYNAIVDVPKVAKESTQQQNEKSKKKKKQTVPEEEDEEEEETTQLNILVFDNYVITVHAKPVKGLDLLLKRIETEFEIDTTSQVSHNNRHRRRNANQNILTIPESNLYLYKYDPVRSLYKHSLFQKSTANLIETETSEETNRQEFSSIPLSNMRKITTPSAEGESVAIAIEELLKKKKTTIPSAGWILYAFLDAIIDIVIPEVDKLVDEVDDLDDLVMSLSNSVGQGYNIKVRRDKMRSALFQNTKRVTKEFLLRQVGEAKQSVTFLKRVLIQKNKLTSYLITRKLRFLHTSVQLYMRDVVDHINSCLEKLEYARELLVQTHSNYTTRVSMDIAALARRTDVFVNRISIIALTITPVNLIASIFGMNVKVPGQDVDNLGWFFGIVGAMGLVLLFLLFLFRKQLVRMKKEQI